MSCFNHKRSAAAKNRSLAFIKLLTFSSVFGVSCYAASTQLEAKTETAPAPQKTFNKVDAKMLTGGVALLPEDSVEAFKTERIEAAQFVNVNGQPFNRAIRTRLDKAEKNLWDLQLRASTTQPVNKNDALLLTFFMRCLNTRDETGDALTTIYFQKKETYEKSVILTLSAGSGWTKLQIPFTATDNYAAGAAEMCFGLGDRAQTIEIGGVQLVDYGANVKVADLPVTRPTYAGREATARWRAEAVQRIEKIRKGNLKIIVTNAEGQPIRGAQVAVNMTRQAFGFGTAVSSANILGHSADDERYRQALRAQFNLVVPGNDLKWDFWLRPDYRQRVPALLNWLHQNGYSVKGHNLVWPGWEFLPASVHEISGDKALLRQTVQDHIREEVSALRGQVKAWDVVNEPDDNHDLMDILGDDSLAQWYRWTHEADPKVKLFLNESIAPAPGARTDRFEANIKSLVAQGAPLDGIGFQSHFGWTLPNPALVVKTLDRFARLHKTISISEYDIDTPDEQLQADYTRDFLIACYSSPAVNEFVMWGFWDGDHWKGNAPLFRKDWTLKPSGKVWADLVKKQWWTRAKGATNGQGEFKARGFLGDYQVTVSQGKYSQSWPLQLTGAGATLKIRWTKGLKP